MTGIHLNDGRHLAVSGVFLYLDGERPNSDFLKGLLDAGDSGAIATNGPGTSSVDGIYAVGPVASVDGDTPPYPALAEIILARTGVENTP